MRSLYSLSQKHLIIEVALGNSSAGNEFYDISSRDEKITLFDS